MTVALNRSADAAGPRSWLRLKSIRTKLLTVVGVGVAFGYAAVIVTSHLREQHEFRAMAFEVNRTLTALMADQAAEGVLSRDENRIERIYFDIVFGDHKDEDHSDVAALAAFDTAGQRVKSYLSLDHLDFPEHELRALAARATETALPQERMIGDVHVVVSPIFRNEHDAESVGAFAVAWSADRLTASLRHDALIHTLMAFFFGALTFGTLALVLQRVVIAPIHDLTRDTLKIARTGALAQRSRPDLALRADEVGVLARQFDRMIEQLIDAREKLLEQSYYGGMAEMAAGVLHNVRNALSPITVGLWKASTSLEVPATSNLERALDELASDGTAPERRAKLATYAKQAFALQTERRQATLAELGSVAEQARHIEQILQDHSLFAKERRRLEPVSLPDVLNEAKQLVAAGPTAPEVQVQPEVADMPAVYGHRIILGQVFGNLFVNAAHSIETAGVPDGRIEVTATMEKSNDRRTLRVSVRDNGMGIDASTLERLFERGFSTKKGKSGGLGLHWSANSLASMGGRICAESDGPGKGATFHLMLPVWQPIGKRQ